MFDVITVGSATIDAFAETDKSHIKGNYYSYEIGSKIKINDLHFDTGGGGTNTAYSFARLGLKTAWIGEIGKDQNADKILELLKKENIDTSMVCQTNEKSGFSVILDAEGHDRTILAFKGSNDKLDYDKLNKKKIHAKWIYASSMLGKSLKSLKKIFGLAKKRKINTAFNPSTYLVKKGKRILSPILSKSDVIIYNREEAQILTGKKDIEDLLKASKKLLKKKSIAVITEGSKGAHAFDGKYKYFIASSKTEIKETTGAGDAFASTFVGVLAKGKDITFAMAAGTINAESVIQHIGAKNKLLTWDELIKEMKKNPLKVKVSPM